MIEVAPFLAGRREISRKLLIIVLYIVLFCFFFFFGRSHCFTCRFRFLRNTNVAEKIFHGRTSPGADLVRSGPTAKAAILPRSRYTNCPDTDGPHQVMADPHPLKEKKIPVRNGPFRSPQLHSKTCSPHW